MNIKKLFLVMVLSSLFCCSQNYSDSGVKEALRESNMTPFDAKSAVEKGPESSTSYTDVDKADDLGGLVGNIPEEWHAVTPSNSMRIAEYHLDGFGGKEDGILAVFYFGSGQGGDTQANINRWISQFQSEDGTPDSRQWNQSVSGMNVERLQVAGTYNVGTMSGGSGESLQDYLLYGAILESPNGSYFFKLTGPEAVLKAYQESFESYISSLRLN